VDLNDKINDFASRAEISYNIIANLIGCVMACSEKSWIKYILRNVRLNVKKEELCPTNY
jgi:hypothetical protein